MNEICKADPKHIRRVILHWLTRRDYTQQEIRQKLSLKNYSLEAAETVITELKEAGLINEMRFTENFIHWRRNKGYGPLRIINELKARGIDSEMIAEHLDITDNAWQIAVRALWQKRFKNKPPRDFNTLAKQMRFMQSRGFTREQIDSVVSIKNDDY